MLLEKLKQLFTRSEMPEETRSLFDGASSTRDLLQKLDDLLTRNEMEFNELNREISKLEEIELEEEGKVRDGNLAPRAKQNTLLYIKRLRKQMDNLQNRLLIFDKNINLHLNLIAKIQDMEAMALKGVEEKDIDAIVVDFQSNFERYMNTVIASEAAQEYAHPLSSREKDELQKMEEEILSSSPQKAPPAKEAVPGKKIVVNPSRLKEEVQKNLDEAMELEEEKEEEKEEISEDEPEVSETPSKKRLLETD